MELISISKNRLFFARAFYKNRYFIRNMATAVAYRWPGAVIKKATHLDRGNCAKVAH